MTINELTKPASTSLVLRRTFGAPVGRVFDAWLTPEAMRGFMQGEHKILDLSVDPRVGGTCRITWDTPNGIMTVGGVYREIVKNERIVSSWTWEEDDPSEVHETLLTLEFHPLGSKTELVLTHTNLRSEESRDGHASGWSTIVEKLADQLERG
jgi:glutathione S-transferase